jgi:prepilin-type N-terminal cleavage/methylation domain-containing protein
MQPKNTDHNLQKGFTFIELIIYVAIVSVMISSLIGFAWNIILGGAKSATQQEVSANARYISERIKYEIRNSFGINSLSSTQIVLCETSGSCATNPTTISFTSPNIAIQKNGAAAVNLNSSDISVTSLAFTNNTSSDNKTENISFTFSVTSAYTGNRQEYQYTVNLRSSAEVRSN